MKIGLAAIAPPDARLFVLGSLPGDASLMAQQYYAHATNQFWRLLGNALDEDLQQLEYRARLARLAERRVGLWDVIASARRAGSLDQAIRDAEHNRIGRILENYPDVEAIAFNGSTAARIGLKLLKELHGGPSLLVLPSSSAANTMPFEAKALAWSELGKWAGAKRLRQA